jgi:thiol-disulfide isomerase/thioredoxin
MPVMKRLSLVAVLATAILATAPLVTAMSAPTTASELASLTQATEWINSPPLKPEELRGRVVLVQFGTYSCINWIRTLPYVRAWARKYRNQGLVVIGVHAPEFEFEKQLANVRWGAKRFAVDYPLAVDNEMAIWRGFANQYWPALYLIDGSGRVRYRHFGEGSYEESERALQELLIEAGARGIDRSLASVAASGVEAPADWTNVKSPETYVGSDRAENRVSPGRRLRLNQWSLAGDWSVQRQAAVLTGADGRITYRFHARDLNLVMAPAANGNAVRFRVLMDGQVPGPAHGIDVDAEGSGVVAEPRMYQLIRQPVAIAEHEFEIQFVDPGVQVFVFTFG